MDNSAVRNMMGIVYSNGRNLQVGKNGCVTKISNHCAYSVTAVTRSPRALFNGLYRHCSAPFVRKRALLLFVRASAPLSSLRSSIHPGIRFRGFLRAVFDFAVHYCENRSKLRNSSDFSQVFGVRLLPGLGPSWGKRRRLGRVRCPRLGGSELHWERR